MANIQAQLQKLSEEFTQLQQGTALFVKLKLHLAFSHTNVELQDSVTSRQKLEAQKQENIGVQKVCLDLRS